jgi:hypothetical protein
MSVWSRAGSELTLSGTTSGRDSALGSASLLGEGSSCTTAEEEDQLTSAGAGTIISQKKVNFKIKCLPKTLSKAEPVLGIRDILVRINTSD